MCPLLLPSVQLFHHDRIVSNGIYRIRTEECEKHCVCLYYLDTSLQGSTDAQKPPVHGPGHLAIGGPA